jgi:hypothetical protein
MEIKLTVPDSIYDQDRRCYDLFFSKIQLEINRMMMSHEKYQNGRPMDWVVESIDEIKSALKRITMYKTVPWIDTYALWEDAVGSLKKPLDTGNTENLLDAINMLRIEATFPKHSKANFRPLTSAESPGLEHLG